MRKLLANFRTDRRGVAALEFSLIFLVMLALLLPTVDLGAAAFSYISAYQAVRNCGAYAQYHVHADVTNPISCSLPSGYNVSGKVKGGDTAPFFCTSTSSPKWFVFTTQFTLQPLVLTELAGTHTVEYAERFQ